jgi:hypothetical protein
LLQVLQVLQVSEARWRNHLPLSPLTPLLRVKKYQRKEEVPGPQAAYFLVTEFRRGSTEFKMSLLPHKAGIPVAKLN